MNFATKHYFLTILFGPLIFIIKSCIYDFSLLNLFDIAHLYFIILFMGLIFSIPTYIIYNFVFIIIKNKAINEFYSKITLTLIIVVGIWVTTAIISGTIWLEIAISYSIPPIITGLIFKSYFKETVKTSKKIN
ncbi:hypothetical protein ACYE2N_14250 [Flavobacterium sp. MAHUQ-51]|uniref:hypothetical protein n=1 Tax=Flavobacterium sp. GCM10022190 TaxID=3252639 RepID=UPI00361F2CCC